MLFHELLEKGGEMIEVHWALLCFINLFSFVLIVNCRLSRLFKARKPIPDELASRDHSFLRGDRRADLDLKSFAFFLITLAYGHELLKLG